MAVQAQQYLDENMYFPLPYSQDMQGFIDIQPSAIIPQQRNQRFVLDSQVSSSDNLASMAFSHFLASQMEKQRSDMDEFIALQVCREKENHQFFIWVLRILEKQNENLNWVPTILSWFCNLLSNSNRFITKLIWVFRIKKKKMKKPNWVLSYNHCFGFC